MNEAQLPPHCRRQQIGYLILYGIGFRALVAVEGTLYYFVPLLRFYGQGQGAFAPGAGQDFHQFPFHRSSHKRRISRLHRRRMAVVRPAAVLFQGGQHIGQADYQYAQNQQGGGTGTARLDFAPATHDRRRDGRRGRPPAPPQQKHHIDRQSDFQD